MTDNLIPTRDQQRKQGLLCACGGADDYCVCQNVVIKPPDRRAPKAALAPSEQRKEVG